MATDGMLFGWAPEPDEDEVQESSPIITRAQPSSRQMPTGEEHIDVLGNMEKGDHRLPPAPAALSFDDFEPASSKHKSIF
jgi:hypothetical protein